MEKNSTQELINKNKTIRNLIIMQAQALSTIDNRFAQKRMVNALIDLGKHLTALETELEKRGGCPHE
jgi:hypothetical protein